MPRTHDPMRDDSIAIGDVIANIPPDEFDDLIAHGELESYVEERLEEDRALTTTEAVTRARDACRDIAEERDDSPPFARDDTAERDDSDGDGS